VSAAIDEVMAAEGRGPVMHANAGTVEPSRDRDDQHERVVIGERISLSKVTAAGLALIWPGPTGISFSSDTTLSIYRNRGRPGKATLSSY
jgi:hypothetical protein